MASSSERFERALSSIDAVHREDPEEAALAGERAPRELLYARRMTAWLEQLTDEPSEALRLAVRAQHLRRWSLPRAAYPEGRAGYHRWRTELARRHANDVAAILDDAGYDEETTGRVQELVLKKRMRTDPEAQLLEDAACLVFLESEFEAFAAKHADDKLVDILQKTWAKMSDRGREAALGLELFPRGRALLERALS